MPVTQRKRVAVIGGGCTGISSFWALQNSAHDVHLFEDSTSLGGRIKQLPLEHDDDLVDIGLPPSFNAAASPNFTSLLHCLGISTSPDPFGFSTSTAGDTVEWGLSTLKTAVRHPGLLCNLETYRILFDIVRFKYVAVDLLSDKRRPDVYYDAQPSPTVQEYLAREGFSSSFRDKYLTPLLSMLWGSNAGKILPHFPIATLCRLLHHHRLLSSSQAGPKWMRVDSGANQIIQSMQRDFPAASVHLKTRVLAARSCGKGRYTLYTSDEKQWHFDHVIFAVDAQESIRILDSAIATKELGILQELRVSKHIAVLHSDPLLAPRKYPLRPSFNYIISKTEHANSRPKTCLSYHLDACPNRTAITIDPFTPPHPRFVRHIWEYTDWEITWATFRALHFLPSIQNKRGLSFCASWTGSGFYEDAVTAGLTVAVDHLGVELPFGLGSHPLDEVHFQPPRIGIRGHLVRTLVALIRVCILVFELFWVLLAWRMNMGRGSRKDGLLRAVL